MLPATTAPRQRKRSERINTLLEEEVLDTIEQEELLSEFRRQHAEDVAAWRTLWGVLGALLALLYAAMATYQALRPWAARPHAYFEGLVHRHAVTAAEISLSFSLVLIAASMFHGPGRARGGGKGQLPLGAPRGRTSSSGSGSSGGEGPARRAAGLLSGRTKTGLSKLLLTAGLAAAAKAALFWGFTIARAVAAYKLPVRDLWRVLWLPAGPAAYALLTQRVLHSFLDTSAEISQLEQSMYHFKGP